MNEINRCTQIAGTMQCEDPEMENSTGDDCEKIGIGVLGLAPCHFSEKRKTDGPCIHGRCQKVEVLHVFRCCTHMHIHIY